LDGQNSNLSLNFYETMNAIFRRASRQLGSSTCAASPGRMLPFSSSASRDYQDETTQSASSWEDVCEGKYSTILVNREMIDGTSAVGTIAINRPDKMNVLNYNVMQEIVSACLHMDRQDPEIKVIVITGTGEKAFAAGADVNEMVSMDYEQVYNSRYLQGYEALRSVRKPMIAAVNGYALGTGCELALSCDIVIASETAWLGQPEILLGIIPGNGGTQRLVRTVGKSRAMEMILTGASISALEAARIGLISRVVKPEDLMKETLDLAKRIGKHSGMALAKAKDCINSAYELSLSEGLNKEKREFWSCFGTAGQKEGMNAFLEKRDAKFS
jgi:enoyl-CoA hydratase/carnithine racemase